MLDKVKELLDSGKQPKDISKELGISFQKVNAYKKKIDADNIGKEEMTPDLFAKSSGVIRDANMGASVIMTAREYAAYSEANGRYQGRAKGQKTQLNTGELRIALTQIKTGKATGKDMLEHLKNKHGITDADIVNVAAKMTREEESTLQSILKPLGLRA